MSIPRSTRPPRPSRISFYVFNKSGGEGIGSYFQEPVETGQWIHVVGVADATTTSIYKDGVFTDCSNTGFAARKSYLAETGR